MMPSARNSRLVSQPMRPAIVAQVVPCACRRTAAFLSGATSISKRFQPPAIRNGGRLQLQLVLEADAQREQFAVQGLATQAGQLPRMYGRTRQHVHLDSLRGA